MPLTFKSNGIQKMNHESAVSGQTLRLLAENPNPATRKAAELLALSGLAAFSGVFSTSKLPGKKSRNLIACVCVEAPFFIFLPENKENPETPRSLAGFRVSGLPIAGGSNPETQSGDTP